MKEIEGYAGYFIGEDGIVWSNLSGKLKIRKQYLNTPNPYKTVGFYASGKKIHKRVHRLVAQAYLPDYSEDLQVNHIDGDKLNNHVSNLEMCTPRENILHAIALGLCGEFTPIPRAIRGDPLFNHKLTEQDADYIRNSTVETRYLCIIFGVDRSHIKRFRSNAATRYRPSGEI